jgi:hypothetical protein
VQVDDGGGSVVRSHAQRSSAERERVGGFLVGEHREVDAAGASLLGVEGVDEGFAA